LIDLAYKGYQTLYAKDESVLAVLSSLMKDLEQLVSLDPDLEGHKKQLEDAQLQLEDLALGLRDFFSGLKVDPKRLEEIDDRFHLIKIKEEIWSIYRGHIVFKGGTFQRRRSDC